MGLRCLWCGAWFSTLCGAFLPGPAVLGSFPCRGLPVCGFCHHMPGRPLRRWLRLGCNPPLVFAVRLLPRLACWGSLGFFTLCQGAPMRPVTALSVTVLVYLMAPHSSQACFLALSSLPAFLTLCVHCLVSLALGWMHFWPAVSTAPVRLGVCCLGCPSWLVLLLRSRLALHLLLRWGGLVTRLWPLLLLLCVELLWSLCCAVLSPWALACPTLSGLHLWIPMVSWSKLLMFSWPLYYGSFLSLPLVTDGSGWLLPALRAGSPTPGWRCVLGMR